MKSSRSSCLSIESSWNSSTTYASSPASNTTTTHCRSNSSSSSSSDLPILDVDFPMPPHSRTSMANTCQPPLAGIPKPLRFSASPSSRLSTSVPISSSFDPSKPPEIPLPPLPPPSPYMTRFIPSLSTPPPQVPLPPIPPTPDNDTDPQPKLAMPPCPLPNQQPSKATSLESDAKQACRGLLVDTSRTMIIGDDSQASSALKSSWSSTTLHDQTCSPDSGPLSSKIEKEKMEDEKPFLAEIDYIRDLIINNEDISSNCFGDDRLDDLVNLSEEEEVQALAAAKGPSGTKIDSRSSITSSERPSGPPRRSSPHISPFDVSHWAILQEKMLASAGQGGDSGIDLNEPLDTLAKRLGYRAATEAEEAVQNASPPSSPSMIIFEEIEERESNYSFLHSQLLLPSSDDELGTTVAATNTEELPSFRSSWRSVSHSSSNSSFESAVQQPLITPPSKLTTSFTPVLERARFSLDHMDLGRSTEAALDLKRSLSASSCDPKTSHRYLHSSQMKMKRRQLPMKVIEEPSSSEEEEFDLSLDHHGKAGGGICPSSLIRRASVVQLQRTASIAQLRSVPHRARNSEPMITQPVSRLIRPKPSASSLLGSSPIARSESVSQGRPASCVWVTPTSQSASKARPLSVWTKPSPASSGPKLVPPLAKVPSNSTKSTSATKPSTKFSMINPSPSLGRTASCSSIPTGQPYCQFTSLSLSNSGRFKSSLPSFTPRPQPVKRSTHGPMVMTPATSSAPSPLGLIPPPGRPGSLERRQWLCAGLSTIPKVSNARPYFPPSSTNDHHQASSAVPEEKLDQVVRQDARPSTPGGWELQMTSNWAEDEALVDIVAETRDTKSDIMAETGDAKPDIVAATGARKSDIEAPQGLSIKVKHSNAGQYFPPSSTDDDRHASFSPFLEEVDQVVRQDARPSTPGGWELQMTSNWAEDEALVDIVAETGGAKSDITLGTGDAEPDIVAVAGKAKSDIEAPLSESLHSEGSPAEITTQANGGTFERRLQLKPLWLSSASVMPEGNSLRTVRSFMNNRNPLPHSTTAAASPHVTKTTNVETEPSALRRSSTGRDPADPGLAHHQLLHHRRSLASLEYRQRAATSAAPISIRQLLYF